MTFPYRRYSILGPQGRAEALYRPDIEVRVRGPASVVTLYGLLDTGADMVLLPAAIAEVVGVPLARLPRGRVRGFAGGPADLKYGEVTLELSAGRETLAWTALVGFVSAWPPEQEVVILGRAGFLEFFDAEFRGTAHEAMLELNRSLPTTS